MDVLALIDARRIGDDGKPLDYMYDFAEILAVREGPLSQAGD